MVVLAEPADGLVGPLLAFLAGCVLLADGGLSGLGLPVLLLQHLKAGTLGTLFAAGLDLPLQLGGLGFRLRHGCGSAIRLARQGQTRGPRHVVLHMKQVGRVMDAQEDFRLAEQGFRFVTDDLTDRHRQRLKFLPQTLVPGLGIAVRLVLFHQEKSRNRFHRYQADVGMEGLVFGDRDLPRRHLGGQSLVLCFGEADQQGFHLLGDLLLGPERRRDEFVQTAEFEKPTQLAEAAVVGLHEHQVRRGEYDVQERQTVAALQKLHHLRRPTAMVHVPPAAAEPISQRAIGYLEFPCNLTPRRPSRIPLIELCHSRRRGDPRRHRLLLRGHDHFFLRGHDQRNIDRGIHGLILLQGSSHNH